MMVVKPLWGTKKDGEMRGRGYFVLQRTMQTHCGKEAPLARRVVMGSLDCLVAGDKE